MKKDKLLRSGIFVFSVIMLFFGFIGVVSAVVSHPLTQITPRDSDYQMNSHNIIDVGAIAVGTGIVGEALTVNGGISISSDPDSDDNVGDRGYNDVRYALSSHNHDGIYAYEMETDDDITSRVAESGCYQTSTATTAEGWPETTNDFYFLLNAQHSNVANNYAMQFAGNFRNNNLYYRSTYNDGSRAWNTVWHEGNDGNSLSADYVDGISSGSLLRSDAADSGSGRIDARYGVQVEGTSGLCIDDDSSPPGAGAGELYVADGPVNVCNGAGDCSGTSTDGNLYVAGNMGIGTPTANSRLSIQHSGDANYAVYASDTIGGWFQGYTTGLECRADSSSASVYGLLAQVYSSGTAGARAIQATAYRQYTGPIYYSGWFDDTGSGGSYSGLYADLRSGDAIDIAELIEDYYNNTEAADVVVAGPEKETVMLSSEPYQTSVVGIVSTKPHMVLGMDLVWNETTQKHEKYGGELDQLTLAGRVPVKVTDENGPIEPGDMLTTSSLSGYAMKWSLLDVTTAQDFEELKDMMVENERRKQAIVGKALAPHASGTGKIIALLTLQ